MNVIPSKIEIINEVNLLLTQKIATLSALAKEAQAAANTEQKSSMGDKYETARAMSQATADQYAKQLSEAHQMQEYFAAIKYKDVYTMVALGSVVRSNMGLYFVAVSLGKVAVHDTEIMCISVHSPLGQALIGKSIAQKMVFRGVSYEITAIY
ncbi:MAG: 3-oxoacyl-ACP synthase [Cytophagales bacterium]|nr:3-oxoacyl-ACP synthase [Cytophagales bacterium]